MATQQSEQINKLEKKLNEIDKMTENQVYQDPIKVLQEEFLKDLIDIRQKVAVSIQKACEIQQGQNLQSSDQFVSKKDYDAAVAENKKLKYRVNHLLKSLNEIDGSAASVNNAVQSIKLYTSSEGSCSNINNQVQITCILSGVKNVQWVELDDQKINSKEIKQLNPSGLLPFIETDKGVISGVPAIVKYLSIQYKKLAGKGDALQVAQINQWVNWTYISLIPIKDQVLKGIFGNQQIFTSDWNDASKELKNLAKIVNNALIEGKGWLVGGQMTLADVIVSVALVEPLQTILDVGFRKAMKELNDWAEKLYSHNDFKKVLGAITLCSKPFKPVCLPDPKKQEEKKAKAVENAEAPKKAEKEEKKKDNVESLPPSSFDLYSFKTLYVNHPDKKGEAIDTFYNMLDWEGWSFWRLEYDIYEGEGDKLHITSNLLNGFISRAEHTNKYTFGRMCVLGEEPKLQIRGCWLMRGQEIPDGLAKEHAQFEYYKTKKLDPKNNKDDDKLIRDYFGGQEGDDIEGLKVQTIRWQK